MSEITITGRAVAKLPLDEVQRLWDGPTQHSTWILVPGLVAEIRRLEAEVETVTKQADEEIARLEGVIREMEGRTGKY